MTAAAPLLISTSGVTLRCPLGRSTASVRLWFGRAGEEVGVQSGGFLRPWLRAPAAQWAFLQAEGDHGVWMGLMGEVGA